MRCDNRRAAGSAGGRGIPPPRARRGRELDSRVRGLKVRLTSTARVEGDIIHKTIAIESGAHFEGSVQRQDDPLSAGRTALPAPGADADGESA